MTKEQPLHLLIHSFSEVPPAHLAKHLCAINLPARPNGYHPE
ncbi:MAG: hypothetical protein QOK37_274 [Thermoanaerobaculia bacterium]|jgi:hypothetical protein|nr:hypothetical protein [Thermoanaerobaculia bacterium]